MNQTLFGSPVGSQGRVVFMGLPFAQGSEASNGCRQGPDLIRSLSTPYNLCREQFYEAQTNQPYLESGDLSDLGNLEYRVQQGTECYLLNLASITSALVAQRRIFFFLGGDHLATLGTIRGVAEKVDSFQILHLDAHRDFREVNDSEFPTHANFMYFVEKMPQVKSIVQLGLRGFDAAVVKSEKRIELPADLNVDLIVQSLSKELPVFVTIDTDAFDPLLMPAVNFPVPEGLSPRILPSLFDALSRAGLRILGCDWMEYNPDLDSQNRISGRLILNYLSSIVKCLAEKCQENTNE